MSTMSTQISGPLTEAEPHPFPDEAVPDTSLVARLRGWLRITDADRTTHAGAHRAARIALIVSGVRCIVSYVLIPVGIPIVGFAGVLAAPISILLCLVGLANSVLATRRFWRADHPRKWMYTVFMAVAFVLLVVAIGMDLARLLAAA